MKKVILFSTLTACLVMLLAGCSKNNGNGGDEPKTYTITVTSGGLGSAEADKTTAEEGVTVTLNAKADSGCEFVKWTVESGDATCSPDESANPATFTMPADNVNIKAEFAVRGTLINGVMWALCNVDAPGTFAAKPEDAGMFYQWNRNIGWSSTDPMTSSPAGITWDETADNGIYLAPWESDNDPCPTGWRMPTHDEQITLCDTDKVSYEWTTLNDVNGAKFTDTDSGNSIFFSASGGRKKTAGELSSVGTICIVRSTTPTGYYGYGIRMASSGVSSTVYQNLAYAYPVRCIAE